MPRTKKGMRDMARRISATLMALTLVVGISIGFVAVAGASAGESSAACSAFGSYLSGLTGASAQAVRQIQQDCAAGTSAVPQQGPGSCTVPSADYPTISSAFGDVNCTEVELTSMVYSPISIDVAHDITLLGNGARFSRSSAGTVFFVEPGVTFQVQDVIFNDAWYGSHAITSYGTLDVTRSLFIGSEIRNPGAPASDGGAIMDLGDSATISLSIFVNELGSQGGAISHYSLGTLTILESAFVGNGQGVSLAGAVHATGGTTDIEQSLFAYNRSMLGYPAVVVNAGKYVHSGNVFIHNS